MDASKNIEASFKICVKVVETSNRAEKRRRKETDPQRNRPFNKAVPLGNIKPANMTASYEM